MKVQISLLSVLLILSLGCSDSNDTTNEEIESIENGLTRAFIRTSETIENYSIQERMEYYKIPGLSIAVIIDGKLRWAKGYGTANSETGTMVNENTMFQGASFSKPVGALAVLQLADQDKVDLDSNVNKYLTSWKMDENGLTEERVASIRLLLSHSAGIVHVHGFAGYKQSEAIPTLDQVLNGEGNSPRVYISARPGEHSSYSGGGYTVIQKLIEDYSGKDYETYVENSVLAPLYMSNSTFAQPLPPEYHEKASAAYDKEGRIIEGFWHNYPEKAAAGIWTTPTDMALYLIEVIEIYNGKEKGLLSREMVVDMLTVQGKGYHGLGPEVYDSDGTIEFGHLGKNAGFSNDMIAGADSRNAIIIMTNADNGPFIMSEIQRSICSYYEIDLGVPDTKTVETTNVAEPMLKGLVGKYHFTVSDTGEQLNQFMEVSVKDGKLRIFDPNEEVFHTMTPLVDNQFLDFNSGLLVEFNKADSVESIIIEDWEARLIKVPSLN